MGLLSPHPRESCFPRENQIAFPPEIKIIFQLYVYFHLIDVPYIQEGFNVGGIMYLKKGRVLSDSNLSCRQSAIR